jgi:hypothetical protein
LQLGEKSKIINVTTNKLTREESTKIMDNFIEKLSKKYSDQNDFMHLSRGLNKQQNYSSFSDNDMIVDGSNENNNHVSNLANTKTFQFLMSNFDRKGRINNVKINLKLF